MAKTKPSTTVGAPLRNPRYWLTTIAVALGSLPLAILVARPSDTLALKTLATAYSKSNLLKWYLTAMSNLGKFDVAMELVCSIEEPHPACRSISFWEEVSKSLFQRGYDLPARQILQRLVLENPKRLHPSHLLVRLYSDLGLHEEALVPGEIAIRNKAPRLEQRN